MSLDILKQIAIDRALKQRKQVDHLTEEAPILHLLPFDASTHGRHHAAEVLKTADSMGIVKMDAPLPGIRASSGLVKFELAKMGGKIEAGEDAIKELGGEAKYFDKQMGPCLKMTGMSTEQMIVYYNLRQYALDQFRAGKTTKTVYDAGGTGNANYSMTFVRFEEGVCSGLYNPDGFGDGVMFDVEAIANGGLYENDDKVMVKGIRLKSDIGFMISGVRNAAVIANIDLANGKLPTETMIDDALADIRATGSGRTMIFCHERVKSRLSAAFKSDRVRMRPADKNIDTEIESWNRVPIVSSYNMFDGTEAREIF